MFRHGIAVFAVSALAACSNNSSTPKPPADTGRTCHLAADCMEVCVVACPPVDGGWTGACGSERVDVNCTRCALQADGGVHNLTCAG